MKFRIDIKWILWFFLMGGIGLSIINFFNLRSLWLDEAMLALNIIKPVSELLKPLEFNQVAPIGFLLVESFFSNLFGNTDWSMRIYPMLLFFVSILLFYFTALRIFKSKIFGLFITAFYSLSPIILSYSIEVKQYMSDVTFGILILLSTIVYIDNNNKQKWVIIALIGAISIWFSNISIILLFTSGLYLIYKTHHSEEKKYLEIVKVLVLWIISFVIYYLLFIHDHPIRPVMVNFWNKAGAFLPKDILSFEFYYSLAFKIKSLFTLLGESKVMILWIISFLLGLYYLVKEKREFLFLLIFPIIVHLFLAYLQIYPFSSRLILYLYPSLLIVIFSGVFYLVSFFNRNQQKLLFYLFPLFLLFNLFMIIKLGFPIEKEEIKKSMSYLNSKLNEEDEIYIYYGASKAFKFYKGSYPLISNTDDKNIIFADEHRENWPQYEESVLKINNSVWILFSHIHRVKNKESLSEEEYILNLFRKNGYEIIEAQKHKGSSIYYAKRTIVKPNY
jgi:uncharacterized membrane protein